MFPHRVSGAVALLLLLAGSRSIAWAGTLSAQASCSANDSISLQWTFTEDPLNPAAHPEWVGYDVLRRSLADCKNFVRVNAQPFPRVFGATHSNTYTESPPTMGTTFEYRVIPVDANRQVVQLDPITCDFCAWSAWASCPEFSAPLTQGTLSDFGWALFVQPCVNRCYQSFYVEDPAMVAALRPFAASGTAVRLYGSPYCGTVEGCGMNVVRYEVAPCGDITPVARASWGRVKAIYR